jgi:hypothetical protein
MNVRDNKVFTPIDLINAKTLSSLSTFFGTNQSCAYGLKQSTSYRLLYKRRLSALGPGGLREKELDLRYVTTTIRMTFMSNWNSEDQDWFDFISWGLCWANGMFHWAYRKTNGNGRLCVSRRYLRNWRRCDDHQGKHSNGCATWKINAEDVIPRQEGEPVIRNQPRD